MDKFKKIISLLEEQNDKIVNLEKRISNLEDTSSPIQNIDEISSKLQGKIDKIGQQNLIIIALRKKPKQSKSELLDLMLDWGVKKTIHKWFQGGNLNNRLLNNGIVKKDGTNSNNEDTFSLTIGKGIPKADELIEKYTL